MDKMVKNINELPLILELKNDHGEKKLYQIIPAGRKFGACLNVIEKEFQILIDKNTQ